MVIYNGNHGPLFPVAMGAVWHVRNKLTNSPPTSFIYLFPDMPIGSLDTVLKSR